MAQRSTVHKAEMSIADIDRGRYASHSLTIALHPSETEERMMLRLLAFAMFADDALRFGPGLSAEGEPDLVIADPTGLIDTWIEVGLPDEKWIRKACGRASRVVVLAYGGHRAEVWWRQNEAALARNANLSVVAVDAEASAALARLAARTMRLDCTVQDGQVWIGGGADGVTVEPRWWRRAPD
ncbi:MAG TPA: YaeQ family protein [Burkholderiaceae bacterium]|nr:YaeQ family protein [Burkholderiaceae bacterium]